jgi:hypothetical protein
MDSTKLLLCEFYIKFGGIYLNFKWVCWKIMFDAFIKATPTAYSFLVYAARSYKKCDFCKRIINEIRKHGDIGNFQRRLWCMWHMSYDIGPHKNEGIKKSYMVIVLVNETYKTKICGISNEELWSPNIWNYIYSKMRDLLITKASNCE